jgi:hypothetical protein
MTPRRMGSWFAMLALASLYVVAAGSTPTYTLIVGPGVALGPLQDTGIYSFTPVSGTIVDLNGDGLPDIVLGLNGTAPAVYLNNGTSDPFANVTPAMVITPPGPTSPISSFGTVAVSDVNADGHPDLVIGGFNAPNMIFLNSGAAMPFPVGTGVAIGTGDVGSDAPALADVNGDGYADMLVANTNHVVSRLYLTQGAPLTSGGYLTKPVGTDVGYAQDARIADVNGDGKPDLILTYEIASTVGTDPSGIAIYLNNGTSDPFNNVTPLRLLVGSSVSTISVADLNQGGKPDLAVAVIDQSVTAGILYVLMNTGSATQPFNTSQTLQANADLEGGCLGSTVADVNGDGLPDLLYSCFASVAQPQPANAAIGSVYLNNGTANPFTGVAPVDIPSAPQEGYGRTVSVGTLMHGGVPDVLVLGEGARPAAYYPTTLDQNPTAQADSVVVALNRSIAISVLANDTAGPGETLKASSVSVMTAPAHGTATVDANGVITYQPSNNYTGSDMLQYTVRDGLGALSNVAAVNITVQPAPVATNDTLTGQENQNLTISILANDTSGGGTLNAASVLIVVAPTHGTAVLNNGIVTYTPANGYTGLDTFQYSVQDNLGTASNVATVSLEIDAPPAPPPAAKSGGGGSLDWVELLALGGLLMGGWVRRMKGGQRAAYTLGAIRNLPILTSNGRSRVQ